MPTADKGQVILHLILVLGEELREACSATETHTNRICQSEDCRNTFRTWRREVCNAPLIPYAKLVQ